MPELETEVELLKQELHDQRKIHDRLDIAIEKLTDVSNSIHRMIAVHDEKITTQEEAIASAEESIEAYRMELNNRVGLLEKWRYIIIGGSIVSGFLLHKFIIIS